MLKFIYIFLTAALSFSPLNFNQYAESSAFINVNHSEENHQLENNRFFNAFAIVTDNAFEEVLNLNTEQEPTVVSSFAIHGKISNLLCNINLNYLKTCSLIDLDFNIRAIIFPFHSFL